MELYLINSYVSLAHFFSLFDPAAENMVVTTDTNLNLIKLLGSCLDGKCAIRTLPAFDSHRNHIYNPLYLRKWRRDNLPSLPKASRLTFFGDTFSLNFFVAIDHFNKDGSARTRFVDAEVYSDYSDMAKLSLIGRLKKTWLNSFGLNVSPLACPFFQTYKYIHSFPNEDVPRLLAWPEIRGMYFKDIKESDYPAKSMLLVDAPIQGIPGIDVEKTKPRLASHVGKFLDDGYKVFIKKHPGCACSSLDGTDVHGSLNFIPEFYPMELFIDFFSDIVNVGGSSATRSVKKFTIPHEALVFESETHRMNFAKTVAGIHHGRSLEELGLG